MELLARWRDKLAGELKAGCLDPPPPQTRVKGVGRNQQYENVICDCQVLERTGSRETMRVMHGIVNV